jgi:hypothetical protein
MAPDGIVEAIDIPADSVLGLGSRLEDGAPDEFGFQCFEERLDHGVVIAVAFAGHRDLDAALGEFVLRLDRSASSRQRCKSSRHAPGLGLSFLSGWRSTPGTGPATSQLDKLSSTTTIRV